MVDEPWSRNRLQPPARQAHQATSSTATPTTSTSAAALDPTSSPAAAEQKVVVVGGGERMKSSNSSIKKTMISPDVRSNTIANTYRSVGVYPPPSCTTTANSSVVKSEIKKFDDIALLWWNDTDGWLTPLHRYVPLRLGFLSYAMRLASAAGAVNNSINNRSGGSTAAIRNSMHLPQHMSRRNVKGSLSSLLPSNGLCTQISERLIRTHAIVQEARSVRSTLQNQYNYELKGNAMINDGSGSGRVVNLCRKAFRDNIKVMTTPLYNYTKNVASTRLLKERGTETPSATSAAFEYREQHVLPFCQNLLRSCLQVLPSRKAGLQVYDRSIDVSAKTKKTSNTAPLSPYNTRNTRTPKSCLLYATAKLVRHHKTGQQSQAEDAYVQELPQLSVLDIGCGGGIVSEALARFSDVREVIGVDASHESIRAARFHAVSALPEEIANKIQYYDCPLENLDAQQEVQRRFRAAMDNAELYRPEKALHTTQVQQAANDGDVNQIMPRRANSNKQLYTAAAINEALLCSFKSTAAANSRSGVNNRQTNNTNTGRYDVVIASEVIEHVLDPQLLMDEATRQVKHGGVVVVTTIAKSWVGWLVAIVGAEDVFKLAQKGTHQYSMLVAPRELEKMALKSGLTPLASQGTFYIPLTKQWIPIPFKRITYMAAFIKT
eukprot:Lankesteria_metandrocarpae@DN3234_c0_g1_i1.p1